MNKKLFNIISCGVAIALITFIEVTQTTTFAAYQEKQEETLQLPDGTYREKIEIANKYKQVYHHPNYKFVLELDKVPKENAPDDGAMKITKSNIDGVRTIKLSGKLAEHPNLNYPMYLAAYMVKPFVLNATVDESKVDEHMKGVLDVAKLYASDNKAERTNPADLGKGFTALKEYRDFAIELNNSAKNGFFMTDGRFYKEGLIPGLKPLPASYMIVGKAGKVTLSFNTTFPRSDSILLFTEEETNPISGFNLSASYISKGVTYQKSLNAAAKLQEVRLMLDTATMNEVKDKMQSSFKNF